MHSFTKFALPFAVLVAAIAFVVGSDASARKGAGGSGQVLFPHPEDIVAINGNIDGATAGTPYKLYTVPSNRWLVVTRAQFLQANSDLSDQSLRSVKGGIETTVANDAAFGAIEPVIGLPFEPGSDVVLRYGSGSAGSLKYHLRGYLAKP